MSAVSQLVLLSAVFTCQFNLLTETVRNWAAKPTGDTIPLSTITTQKADHHHYPSLSARQLWMLHLIVLAIRLEVLSYILLRDIPGIGRKQIGLRYSGIYIQG